MKIIIEEFTLEENVRSIFFAETWVLKSEKLIFFRLSKTSTLLNDRTTYGTVWKCKSSFYGFIKKKKLSQSFYAI